MTKFSRRRPWWLTPLEPRDLPSSVVTPFTPRFSRNDTGDIALVGNTLLTAPAGPAGDAARNGTGANVNNNNFNMVNVDVDSDATTFNSSRATLNMPSGVTVLFAGLYWGAVSAAASRNTVMFQVPATGGAYVNLTGTVLGASGNDYHAFVDVTPLVQISGNGVYTVANVQDTINVSDVQAGWGLVVVYRDPAAPPRNLTVFDGLLVVNTTAPSTISTTISGFTTPLSGPVNAHVGFMTYEGDLGFTGDFCKLNNTTLADAQNPANNFFNSSVSNLGVPAPGRTPSYVNQMSFDLDLIDAPGVIANGANSATVTVGTTQDVYYPGVITTAIDIYAPIFVTPKKVFDVTSNGGVVSPGDVLEYTMNVQNTGGDNAILSTLTDAIPTYTTYEPGSLQILTGPNTGTMTDAAGDDQAEFDKANNRVVYRLGTGATAGSGGGININQSSQVSFRVRVNPDAPNNTPITNQATATGKGQTAGLIVSSASAAAAAVVVASPAGLHLEKDVDNPRPNVGDIVTFTLRLTNFGPAVANGVVVRDQLPAGLTLVNASGTGSYDSATGDWTVGTVTVNTVATLTVTATVTGPNPTINSAKITASSAPDPDPSDNTASTPVTPRWADLGLVKSVDDANPAIGEVITYTLALTDYGPDPATNITVNDPMPAGAAFVSASTQNGFYDPASGLWTLFGLPETGTAYLIIHAVVTASPPSANFAAIIGADQYDPSPANNTATAAAGPPLADLSLVKTVDDPTPTANQVVTFTLTVTNSGPAAATNVRVSDLLPAGLLFVSATPSVGSYDSTNNVWTVGTVPNGATRTLTVQAKIIAPAPSMNRAVVSSDVYDPDPGDNLAVVGLTPQTADIDVDKQVSTNGPAVGDIIAYSVRVRNRGPNAATGVVVNDTLPAGVTLVQSIPSQGSFVAGTGIWTVGALAAGAEAALVLVVQVTNPSAISNAVAATSNQFDPVPNNNFAVSTITPPQSDLQVVKSVAPPAPTLGDLVTYTVTVTNNGPDAATLPTVYDPLPGGLEFAFASATAGSYDPDTGTWSLPSLASGASATLTLVALVVGPGAPVNTARVSAAELDPDLSNNAASAPLTPGANITGSVYDDLDGDGLRGVGEPGIAGATVRLLGPGNVVVATAVSDADGVFTILGVPPGKYSLAESQPAGYLDGLDAAGTAGGTVGNDLISIIPVGAGARLTGYTFGEHAPAPAVTIANASAVEGTPVTFAVTLANAAGYPIILDLFTAGGTATAGADYVPNNFQFSADGGVTWLLAGGPNDTQVTIPTGETGILVRVDTIQDTIAEANETFNIFGSSVRGPVASVNPGTGTIIDDDAPPAVTFGSASAVEGNPIDFSVSLSNPFAFDIVLDLTASGGTATAGADYSATNFQFSTDGGATWQLAGGPNGTQVTIPAGSTSILVRVDTLPDNTPEANETFNLTGTTVSGSVSSITPGIGTIIDDDTPPTVTIGNASATEGSPLTFTITMSNAFTADIVLDLTASGGTATAGADYDDTNFQFSTDGGATWQSGGGLNGTEITIPAGSLGVLVRVDTLPDGITEPTETFNLSGNVVSGAVAAINPGTGSILDDDTPPTVTIGSAAGAEGSQLVFSVTMSNAFAADIVLDLTASGGTATAGADYLANNFQYSTDGGATWQTGGGPNGTQVTIPAGSTSILVRVTTLQDTIAEPTETFNLTGVAVSGSVAAVNGGTGTIFDDDSAPAVTIGNATAIEGSPLVFAISLSNAWSTPIVLNLTASGGTATAGADYLANNMQFSTDGGVTWQNATGPNGTQVTIPAGAGGIQVRVTTLQDSIAELNETFNLSGTAISGSVSGVTPGTGTIVDDDSPPSVTISNGSATEGSPITFTLTFSAPSGVVTVLDLMSSGGTATAGADYTPSNFQYSTDGGATWQGGTGPAGTRITVPAGVVTVQVKVATVQDTIDEPDETFNLSGSVVSGLVSAVNPGTGTIVDDDPAPTVTIGSASATEGSPIDFTVSLSNPSAADITLDLTASGGTATAGADYSATNFQFSTDNGVTWQNAGGPNGTQVTVPAGATSILVRVTTIQDTIDEPNETFNLSGNAIAGTVTAVNPGTGTIVDDDPAPTITIANASATEGSPVVFTLSLTNPSSAAIVLDLSSSGGTATAGVDYLASNFQFSTDSGVTWQSGTGPAGTRVTIPAGITSLLVRVATIQDTIDEPNEMFNLSGAVFSGSVTAVNGGTGTIIDDDPAPTVTIANASATEGSPIVFTLSLSNPSSSAIVLDLTASGGTATATVDYSDTNFQFSTDSGVTWQPAGGLNGTRVTVPAGGMSILVRVDTIQDSIAEPNETFNLSGAAFSGSITAVNPGIGTILDDDGPPTVTIGSASATEGSPIDFTVSLSNPSAADITLDLTASGGTATAGADYSATNFQFSTDNGVTWQNAGGPNGTQVTVPAGATSILVRVTTIQDTIDEPNETFNLSGNAIAGTVTAVNPGTGTIVDDDPAPTITIANASATEGSPVVFTLSLTNPSSAAIVLDLSSSGGTATAGVDYLAANFQFSTDSGVTWQNGAGPTGTRVTIPAGATSILVRVATIQDTIDEPNETFNLSGAVFSGSVTAVNGGTGTIVDDDPAPTVTIANSSATEGSPIAFTLSLSNPSSSAIILDLTASGGTATAGTDYSATNFQFSTDGGATWQNGTGPAGTRVTVPAGGTSFLVRVATIQDTLIEPNETFTLSGSASGGAVAAVNPGIGTIIDDDASPTITIGSASAVEGSPVVFTVTLSAAAPAPIVLDLTASGGTATAGADYADRNFQFSTDGGVTWQPAAGPNGTQVTIPAGVASVRVKVATVQDTIDEPDETFTLAGKAVSGTVTAINPGVGTIVDDDPAPTVAIADARGTEGGPIDFRLSLSNPSSAAIVLNVSTFGGTAMPGADYAADHFQVSTDGGVTWQPAGGVNGTRVTIPVGATSALVRVATVQDSIHEPDETFNLTGTAISGAVSAVGVATGTIVDDDPAPASVAGVVFYDGNQNGVQDADEPGIAGVTIALGGTDDLGQPVQRTFVTGPSGTFAFTGLRPGQYALTETQPHGFDDGREVAGSQGGVAGNHTIRFTLAAGVAGSGNLFGQVVLNGANASKEQLLASTPSYGAVLNGFGPDSMAGAPSFANAVSATHLAPPAARYVATGAAAGGGPRVRVFDFGTATERFDFFAYDLAFTGGVRVATGDVTGDGVPDIITAPGAGGGPHIKVFDGATGKLVAQFMAYDPAFTGGVYVAAGDTDGDGKAEIIVGAGEGGGPHVRVFDAAGHVLAERFAYDPRFTGGVRVAAGDVNGDGKADVIVGAGPSGGPNVRVYSAGLGAMLQDYFAYDINFRGGVYVAAGDVNGDGKADVITGAGAGGGPDVRVFSGLDRSRLAEWFAYDAAFAGGVTVAAEDVNGDGRADIITAPASGLLSYLRVTDVATGADLDAFLAYGTAFRGGAYVG